MIVSYCDRCGQEMSGPSGDSRFIALQDEHALQSRNRFPGVQRLPIDLGLPMTLAGRNAVILHICGDCGASLLTWVANP